MVAQGLINSNSYSLFLKSLNTSSGHILFGGVGTAHYHGPLATLSLQEVWGSLSQFPFTFTGINFGDVVIANNLALAITLTCGDTLTYPPNDLAQAVLQEVRAYFDENSSVNFMPCSQSSAPGALNFKLSSIPISIPMNELVLNIELPVNPSNPAFIGGQGILARVFAIAPALETLIQLGASFMRSAYLVSDIDNNEISMAYTNFAAKGTNVMELGTGRDSVPDATPVAEFISAKQGTGMLASTTLTTTSGLRGKSSYAATSGFGKIAFVRYLGVMVIVIWTIFYVRI